MMCACAMVGANAQTSIEESEEFIKDDVDAYKKNWFITVAGGGQVYFGDHDKQCDLIDRIAPNAEIAVGKWLSPIVGFRAMYSGLQVKGATNPNDGGAIYSTGKPFIGHDGDNLEFQKINMANVHADVMFNLVNLFAGYRPERALGISPYLGLGMAFTYDEPGLTVDKHGENVRKAREISADLGVFAQFRLSKAFDLNVDVRGTYINDRFDGEYRGRLGEGMLSASVGVTYKFPLRGFPMSRMLTRTITEVINRGGANTNGIYDAGLQEELETLRAENERLKVDRTKVTKLMAASANLITFPIGKSTLSNQARVNIGMFAETIKMCDSDIVYTISGYADKGTGSVKKNQKLSEDRAKAVYDCLVNEFGVNPKQLKLVSNGGVDNMYYDDPNLSRAVISRAE